MRWHLHMLLSRSDRALHNQQIIFSILYPTRKCWSLNRLCAVSQVYAPYLKLFLFWWFPYPSRSNLNYSFMEFSCPESRTSLGLTRNIKYKKTHILFSCFPNVTGSLGQEALGIYLAELTSWFRVTMAMAWSQKYRSLWWAEVSYESSFQKKDWDEITVDAGNTKADSCYCKFSLQSSSTSITWKIAQMQTLGPQPRPTKSESGS